MRMQWHDYASFLVRLGGWDIEDAVEHAANIYAKQHKGEKVSEEDKYLFLEDYYKHNYYGRNVPCR